jgi:hypothetical protein
LKLKGNKKFKKPIFFYFCDPKKAMILKFLFLILVFINVELYKCYESEVHYNTPDPDCNGPFGLCTQEDKNRLGYAAVKKLHEKMDDDRDGQIEIQETKEFLTEELEYDNEHKQNERHQKFHGNDLGISIDELWKSWKHSEAHNWTTDEVVFWLSEHVQLPQYSEYFRRNRIDGQFLPRFCLNENNYFSQVMHIKDLRHKHLLMVKATDLVVFGQTTKPHNLIKDIIMISLLTLSIFVCIFLYSKHRQSLEQIKNMINEFDKLATSDELCSANSSLIRQLKKNLNVQTDEHLKQAILAKLGVNNASSGDLLHDQQHQSDQRFEKENQLIIEKNHKLALELSSAKQEAESLRRTRESTTDGQLMQLKLAEQELDKVRNVLRQTESRLETVRYQPPSGLIHLLNRTYESEKELLEYKFKLIDKEKESCLDALNKVSKRQSGILGALKIAHSTTLEELNHKLELLKREIQKCKSEKHEWTKRWNNIDEFCHKSELTRQNSISSENLSYSSSPQQQQQQLQAQLSIDQPLSKNLLNGIDVESSYSKNSKSVLNSLVNITLNSAVVQSKPVQFTLDTTSSKYSTNPTSASTVTNNQNGYLNENVNVTSISKNICSNNNIIFIENPVVNSNGFQAISNEPSNSNLLINKSDPNNNNNNQKCFNLNSSMNPKDSLQQNYYSNSFMPISEPPAAATVTTSLSLQNSLTSSQSNLQQQQQQPPAPSNMPKIITPVMYQNEPIKRESLIHKNDVFQFDDVDSVHTADIYFKKTPVSSFDSSSFDVNDSWPLKPKHNNATNNNNNKKITQKHSNKLANFITPIFRSNSNSSSFNILKNNNNNNNNKSARTNSIFYSDPKTPNGTINGSGSKIKKSITNVNINDIEKNSTTSASLVSFGEEADNSHQSSKHFHKKSLQRHFNSFKKLIHSKTSQKSTPNLATVQVSPITYQNTSSILTTISSNKQLTINANTYNDDSIDLLNDSDLTIKKTNNHLKENSNNIIIKSLNGGGTSSFTIKTRLSIDDDEDSEENEDLEDMTRFKPITKNKY